MTAEPTLKQGHDSESEKKTFEYDDQNATKKNVCYLRHKHSKFQSSNTNFDTDSMCLFVSCDQFSHSVSPPFLLRRTDRHTRYKSLSKMVKKCLRSKKMPTLLLLPQARQFLLPRAVLRKTNTICGTRFWSSFVTCRVACAWRR